MYCNYPIIAITMSDGELLPLWAGMRYYEHQIHGTQWMLHKETVGTEVPVKAGATRHVTVYGGLQCDDMGLGKTIQILGMMRNNPQPKTLLLCPLAMVSTWVETATKAGFPTYTVAGGTKSRHWAYVGGKKPGPQPSLFVTNYDHLVHNPSLLLDTEREVHDWDRVVCDEAHRLRNPGTVLYHRASKIQARLRWTVTGTPIVNSFKDAAALFRFIGVPVSKSCTWESHFYELIGGLVVHRSMEEIRGVVAGVPPVPIVETKVLDFASEEEEELYRACQGLVDKLKYHRDSLTRNEMLVLLLRLRQLSVSPQVYTEAMRSKDPLYDLTFTRPSTKALALAELIDEAPTGKFLIFCSFLREMELLQEFLEETFELDGGVELYHGGLTGAERTATLARVKKPKCRVMLVQLQSGGVGLNLQEFDNVVFMSPWWTAALMDQAVARAVRIGQTKTVKVTHLRLAEEEAMNIDKIMADKADTKRGLLMKFFDYALPPAMALALEEEVEEEAEAGAGASTSAEEAEAAELAAALAAVALMEEDAAEAETEAEAEAETETEAEDDPEEDPQ
jgi:SNF2 family DNA or RNA helicase